MASSHQPFTSEMKEVNHDLGDIAERFFYQLSPTSPAKKAAVPNMWSKPTDLEILKRYIEGYKETKNEARFLKNIQELANLVLLTNKPLFEALDTLLFIAKQRQCLPESSSYYNNESLFIIDDHIPRPTSIKVK